MILSLFDTSPSAELYRIESMRYAASVDEFGESRGTGRLVVQVHTYPIISYTPKGAWIDAYGKQKFVNLRAVKQWACGTVSDAREAFHYRKLRQIQILEAQLRTAKEAMVMNKTSLAELTI